MSVESYDSSGVIEQEIEIYKAEIIHRKVAETVLDSKVAQKNVCDFMWNYVGHPDKRRRLTGERPGIKRTIDETEIDYTREVYTGFSDDGDLFHIRAVPGMLTEAQGFMVAGGNIHTGILEPVVHRSSTIGGIDPREIRLQLLDRRAMDNAPWGHCPGQYAPPYDQYMLHISTGEDGEQKVFYREARDRMVMLHPIESLLESVDLIEAERTLLATERALLARSAFTLISGGGAQ